MNVFQWLFFIMLLVSASVTSQDVLKDHNQLMVVIGQDWNAVQAQLQRYEREDGNQSWIPIGEPIAVVIGKAGLAWGIGLHSFPINRALLVKAEGDLKSPAGIFSIGSAFGFVPNSKMMHLNMDYIQIDDATEAVDDPLSQYYNRLVNRSKVSCDWQSSEKMAEISLYKLGLVIEHNYPNAKPKGGSAIFLHEWKDDKSGTAGCTAMEYENLNQILYWLRKDKNPILIQLPKTLYDELQEYWELPCL